MEFCLCRCEVSNRPKYCSDTQLHTLHSPGRNRFISLESSTNKNEAVGMGLASNNCRYNGYLLVDNSLSSVPCCIAML